MLLACEDGTGSLAVYNPETTYTVPLVKSDVGVPLTSCCFTSLAEYFIFTGDDGSWMLHNSYRKTTLAKVLDPLATKGISVARLHPDGVLLATGSYGGAVSLWDLRSNMKIGRL